MVSISLVMSVIVTNIYMRKDTSSRVPRCLRRLLLHHHHHHDADDDADDVDDDVMKQVARSAAARRPPLNGKVRDADVWTVTVHGGRRDSCHEEVVTPSSRRRRHAAIDDMQRRRATPVGRQVAVCAGRHDDLAADEDDGSEWQQVARVVDRLFFWLFMVSSVALLTALYVSID